MKMALSLMDLPVEILDKILDKLDYSSQYSLSRTCKTLENFFNSKCLLRRESRLVPPWMYFRALENLERPGLAFKSVFVGRKRKELPAGATLFEDNLPYGAKFDESPDGRVEKKLIYQASDSRKSRWERKQSDHSLAIKLNRSGPVGTKVYKEEDCSALFFEFVYSYLLKRDKCFFHNPDYFPALYTCPKLDATEKKREIKNEFVKLFRVPGIVVIDTRSCTMFAFTNLLGAPSFSICDTIWQRNITHITVFNKTTLVWKTCNNEPISFEPYFHEITNKISEILFSPAQEIISYKNSNTITFFARDAASLYPTSTVVDDCEDFRCFSPSESSSIFPAEEILGFEMLAADIFPADWRDFEEIRGVFKRPTGDILIK